MPKFGIVIDLDKCSGCQACSVACAMENNLPAGSADLAEAGRLLRWLQMLPQFEGEYPHYGGQVVPMMCQHCDRPPCTLVCPVSATYSSADGTVAQIYWRCIGCRYCVNACPYTMKWFNWFEPQWPGDLKDGTNPDVEIREKGVTEKCTFCHHKLQIAKERAKAEGRAIRPDEYVPACAMACPTEAIVFGDIEDPESDAFRKSRGARAFRFLEDLGTNPKVIYLKSM